MDNQLPTSLPQRSDLLNTIILFSYIINIIFIITIVTAPLGIALFIFTLIFDRLTSLNQSIYTKVGQYYLTYEQLRELNSIIETLSLNETITNFKIESPINFLEGIESYLISNIDSGTIKNRIMMINTCPKCGKKLLNKKGKFGGFIGCTGYPNCKFTQKI